VDLKQSSGGINQDGLATGRENLAATGIVGFLIRPVIRKPFLIPIALFLTAIAALLAWTFVPAPTPRVVRTDRLTRSGRARWAQRVLTDGVRLYFAERIGGRQVLASAPIDGGDPVLIPTPFSDTISLLDISPDHTKLLLSADDREEGDTTFWTVPVAGGSPERLGVNTGNDAVWFPNGRRILFTHGSDIYTADEDGGEPRKVSTVNGRPWGFHWSPDGRVLRFTVENAETQVVSIWEADADGAHPRPWSAVRTPPKSGWLQGESGGVWTLDGNYFVYRSMRDTTAGLWAIREQKGLRGRFNNKPFLLYTFPGGMAYLNPLISPDGKRIFFVAEQESRELMRYDQASQRSVSYLGGISGRMVDFSRDGKWVVYYSYDYHLWRSRVDGSDRLQLTFPPLSAGRPRWSPDGTRIAFRGDQGPANFRIYLIPPEGGTPQAITPAEFTRAFSACWSPDGKSLIFSEIPPLPYTARRPELPMQRVDVKTAEVTALPGSEGLNAQDLSPDGQNIVAFAQNDSRLVLFNLASHQITELARGKTLYAAFWSRDGRYIYYQDLSAGAEQPISRVRLSDHKIEPVAGLSQFNPADATSFSLAGLTSDDSPLASVILNRGDVYALKVDFP
jgi:Tol biopolymer transport system component